MTDIVVIPDEPETNDASTLSLDGRGFRDVLAALAGGVAVVTTVGADGRPRGLTTTAVASVSVDPPLVLVCVDGTSRTLPAIRHASRFCINFVSSEAGRLAEVFASKAEEKFEDAAWRLGESGSPILHEDAIAWLECRIEREIELGGNVIVIGHVERGHTFADERLPLTYFRRGFGTWTPASA